MDNKYLESLFGLAGKVAVVTGGGGILCGAMSRALARAGAKVAVLDLNEAAARRVADDVAAAGGDAIAVRCDVLDKASIEAAAQEVLGAFGQVDILINGAGGNKREATTRPDLPFFDLPADAVQWVFNLNFIGTLLPSQVFGRLMAEQGHGVILNVSSMNALRPLTRIPA
ncbi:MAG: SDR family NAD(P)-dependent oxidoreductase, partial [Anaerolineae bacterium]|nr:SDR family NAD(P)-dependent oxidoreductase [Anaerolineae bacterium]